MDKITVTRHLFCLLPIFRLLVNIYVDRVKFKSRIGAWTCFRKTLSLILRITGSMIFLPENATREWSLKLKILTLAYSYFNPPQASKQGHHLRV